VGFAVPLQHDSRIGILSRNRDHEYDVALRIGLSEVVDDEQRAPKAGLLLADFVDVGVMDERA
jgi:hypothetical protein